MALWNTLGFLHYSGQEEIHLTCETYPSWLECRMVFWTCPSFQGRLIGSHKGSHSQTLAPFGHGHTRRRRGRFLGFPGSSCWLWSVSWHDTNILYYFLKIPQLPVVLSSTSWSWASKWTNSCQHMSKEVRGRDLQQLNLPSFWNAEHFSFSISCESMMWQRSTHLTSRLLSTVATAFPARKSLSPYLAPKRLNISRHFWRCTRHFCPPCQA